MYKRATQHSFEPAAAHVNNTPSVSGPFAPDPGESTHNIVLSSAPSAPFVSFRVCNEAVGKGGVEARDHNDRIIFN